VKAENQTCLLTRNHAGRNAGKPASKLALKQASLLAGTDFHRENGPKHRLGEKSDTNMGLRCPTSIQSQ
jgi:hypothetical protein